MLRMMMPLGDDKELVNQPAPVRRGSCSMVTMEKLIADLKLLSTSSPSSDKPLNNNKATIMEPLLWTDSSDNEITEKLSNQQSPPSQEIEAQKQRAVLIIRNHMVQIIGKLLKAGGSSMLTMGNDTVASLAERIERLMFEQSPLEEYCNMQSLESRTNSILKSLNRKPLASKFMTSSVSRGSTINNHRAKKRKRDEAMKACMPPQLAAMAHKLIAEIQFLKCKHVATAKCGSRCGSSSDGDNDDGAATFCSGEVKSAKSSLPAPLYQLFFHTKLVQVYETVPAERFSKLPWKELLQQAIHNLRAYQKYRKEQSNGGMKMVTD